MREIGRKIRKIGKTEKMEKKREKEEKRDNLKLTNRKKIEEKERK